jgi:uncharacterized YigZ family protein
MATVNRVPACGLEREIEIRKSRFIARVVPVADREQAMAVVEQAVRDHPDARHHCWAYLIGDPTTNASAAMSDDGEPSGTAGKPILNVIRHKGLGNLIVVVIRYFGGIKLGAGGLVRAYAGATEAVLSAVPVTEYRPTVNVRLVMDHALEQALRHWAAQHEATVDGVDYAQRVSMQLSVPEAALDEMGEFCAARGIRIEPPETKKPA